MSSVSDIVEAAKSAPSYFSNIWNGIKRHWMSIALCIAIIVVIYRDVSNGQAVSDLLETHRRQLLDSHDQIEALETIVNNERAAREALQNTFEQRVNEIDTRYSREIENIRRDRARRMRELANNPEELDRLMDERFGLAH